MPSRLLLVVLSLSIARAAGATEGPGPSSVRATRARTGALAEVVVPTSRVLVPAGWFTFGASTEQQAAALELCRRDLAALDRACNKDLFSNEGPAARVYLPSFYLDRFEVTNAAYRRCVEAGTCDPAPLLEVDPRLRDPRLPVVRVSWFDAGRYCRFAGGHLPSELQWERAARGPSPRIFPWGDAPLPGHANAGRFVVLDAGGPYARPAVRVDERDGYAFLAPPGSFPSGASPDGILDLAGNVSEWVADVLGDEGPVRGPGASRAVGASPRRMLRGGSYRQPLIYLRTTAWDSAPADLRSAEVGFRCASERAIEAR